MNSYGFVMGMKPSSSEGSPRLLEEEEEDLGGAAPLKGLREKKLSPLFPGGGRRL